MRGGLRCPLTRAAPPLASLQGEQFSAPCQDPSQLSCFSGLLLGAGQLASKPLPAMMAQARLS